MPPSEDRRSFVRRFALGAGSGAIPSLDSDSARPAPASSESALEANRRRILNTIRIAFVGVGDRGSYHLDAALGIPGVEVPALCDINPAYLHRAKRWVEASGQPTPNLYDRGEEDFRRLCAEEDVDLVICATSWKWHVPVCLEGMRNDKHVVSEVPIALKVDEGWEITETHEKTGKWATLGLEGFRSLTVTHMAHQGVFGEIRHAEAGYVHDLRLVKFDPEREPWRLAPSRERNGNLYPDHPMSAIMPALDINHGDRFDSLMSLSSKAAALNKYAELYYGHDHPYASMPMAQGDYNATLLRTAGGKLITLNFDTNTPHPRGSYRLQGTKGAYWSPRYTETPDSKIYLDGISPDNHRWENAGPYLEKYEHPILKNYSPPAREAIRGHGGRQRRTPIEWHRLIDAIRHQRMPDWNVYDSVTSSIISPLTEESVARNGRPVKFPDFTRGAWKSAPRWMLT